MSFVLFSLYKEAIIVTLLWFDIFVLLFFSLPLYFFKTFFSSSEIDYILLEQFVYVLIESYHTLSSSSYVI